MLAKASQPAAQVRAGTIKEAEEDEYDDESDSSPEEEDDA